MRDKITISITPELHSAIIIASTKNDASISRTIEDLLRNSPDCQKFLIKAREYSESEENVNPSAVGSDHIRHLRRSKSSI
ncbi:MAG: hypothetical protein LVQ97_03135 [Candidatus Micrarchaeales archaeon]|jgi:hypothetical protein|nr:hypothetical protein [Candidatus Micrarchaeales archaeon]